MLTSLILLTSCGGEPILKEESNSGAMTPTTNSANNTDKKQNNTEINQPKEASFKSELTINMKSYQDQLAESDFPALEVLEKNLTALVEHDHSLFASGFVNEKLAEAMEPYYGEQYYYKFTGIESIDDNLPNEHQVNITVIGQRLDTTSDTIEEVKMLYAIRENDIGVWVIYTID